MKKNEARTLHQEIVHSHIHWLVRSSVGSYVFAYMRETNRFRSMFLAQHTFIYSWAHTYVFRNRCDSHSVHTIRRYTHFTICCMQKITKKTNESSRKQPGNSWPKYRAREWGSAGVRIREKYWCCSVRLLNFVVGRIHEHIFYFSFCLEWACIFDAILYLLVEKCQEFHLLAYQKKFRHYTIPFSFFIFLYISISLLSQFAAFI